MKQLSLTFCILFLSYFLLIQNSLVSLLISISKFVSRLVAKDTRAEIKTFHPDCKTVFFLFFKHFQAYISIFMA